MAARRAAGRTAHTAASTAASTAARKTRTSIASATSFVVAALVLGSLVLAGCGGDATPDASSSLTSTASPTTTAPPTASPTTDPNIPAAARAHTPAGAEAFVRYFYSQLNIAWGKPQAGLISGLSAMTCKTCAALEGSAVELASKRQHYAGEVFAVETVGATGESEVLVTGEQPEGAVIDINGSVVRSKAKAEKAKFIVTLAWSPGGWRVLEMKVLK